MNVDVKLEENEKEISQGIIWSEKCNMDVKLEGNEKEISQGIIWSDKMNVDVKLEENEKEISQGIIWSEKFNVDVKLEGNEKEISQGIIWSDKMNVDVKLEESEKEISQGIICSDMVDTSDYSYATTHGNTSCSLLSGEQSRPSETAAGVIEEDVVANLLVLPFSRLDFNEKLNVVQRGRPTPALTGLVQRGKGFERHFQANNYERYPWMTGCEQTKKLYCWDCLLFSTDKSSTWASAGFTDLASLTKSALRHQNSTSHLRATVSSKTFGDTGVDLQLKEQQHRVTLAHNEKVRKNREILKRLIHTVVLLGKQELTFRGHEGKEAANKGNYLEMLDFLAEYDSPLNCHLATATVFIGTSSKIQNDLIHAVADVMTDAMKEEVRKTPFITVMVDDTTDISHVAQMSYVLRYTTDSGVKERFFKYDDVTEDKRAEAVAARVLRFLEEYGCTAKVVAQCYDGAAVMASGLNGVQAKVKETIPQALFIHCYAHTLNRVMSQGAAKFKKCKIFFSHLSGIAAFFSRSVKRTKLLDEICQRRVPGVAPIRWNFSSRLVCTVHDKREELLELFEYIVDHHDDFDEETVHSADGHITRLTSFQFCFLLSTFNSIFAYSDVVFGILQNREFDMQFCLSRIDDFCSATEREKGKCDSIYEDTVRETGDPSGRRAQTHGDIRAQYQQLHSGIIDNLLTQLRNRFKDHERLMFLALLDPQQFPRYRETFPNTEFSSLKESYGPHFDLPRLKTELTVMYSMSDFEGRSPADLLHFLRQKRLNETMYQLYLLTCLVLTIPMSTASDERTFSALKRIKTYCRNTTGQARLSALALISIEKVLLLDLKSMDKLYDSAIAHFIKKDQLVDFVFK